MYTPHIGYTEKETMSHLTVALATYNEEKNLSKCLKAVVDIASEIVIVDGSSNDKTVEVAKSYHAKIQVTENLTNFHINKQKAINMATKEWVLLLDADEIVTPKLAREIQQVLNLSETELIEYEEHLSNRRLLLRHQALLENRDGKIGKPEGSYTAFFIPRLNYFLGKYLIYGGVYPDGVIRLFKRGTAHLPAKDVHEQMVVEGRVGWLENPLYHMDSPTFKRYLSKNNRYINFLAQQLAENKTGKDIKTRTDYLLIKPLTWFFMTQIRHKGILDGYQGMIFSFFSALRFPRAYWQYTHKKKNKNE